MCIAGRCNHTSSRSSRKKSDLHQIRFINIFYCDRFLAYRSGDRFKSDGTSVIVLYHRRKKKSVDRIETERVNLKAIECKVGIFIGDNTVAKHLCKITHTL